MTLSHSKQASAADKQANEADKQANEADKQAIEANQQPHLEYSQAPTGSAPGEVQWMRSGFQDLQAAGHGSRAVEVCCGTKQPLPTAPRQTCSNCCKGHAMQLMWKQVQQQQQGLANKQVSSAREQQQGAAAAAAAAAAGASPSRQGT